MICIYCQKKLRRLKRIDFRDREYHLSCKEKENQKQYEKELTDFVEWFKNRGVVVRV